MIRHVLTPRQPARRRAGTLPRAKLRAVVEYVEEHLDGSPTLEQLAAVARLSPYHFARQFKAATGLPPHQYVITRRVERAKELLQAGTALSLAEVAAHVGFSDQSHFSSTSSVSSALRRDSSGRPQESNKSRKSRQETPERPAYHCP